jgi:uncharacterized protein YqgC (DUF456 family)
MTLVNLVVALLVLAGLAGAVVPMLPGTPLILAGALLHAIANDFTPIGAGRLAILAVLAALGAVLGHLAAAAGVRRAGGSGWAIGGALIGTVIGLFTAPLGLLLGPLVGAVAGEVLRTGRVQGSVRAGVGALLGMVLGAAAHVAVAFVMVALFAWWVWRS